MKEIKNTELFMEEFQHTAVKCLLEDRELFEKVVKIIDQNAFKTPLNVVVGCILDFYKKSGHTPSYEDLHITVNSLGHTNRTDEIKEIYMVKAASMAGMESVKEEIVRFFRLKKLVYLSNTILQRISNNDSTDLIIKQAQQMFNDIYRAEADNSVVTLFTKDTLKSALMETDEEVVPTGINKLDSMLAGGLGRKEIGLFVAPTGYGKTTFGTILAHNAARLGYNVLQIFLEDKPNDIVRKHMAMSMVENSHHFKGLNSEQADKVITRLESLGEGMLDENLILLKMEDGTTTVEDIKFKIKQLYMQYNFKPDMIVIDYFSALQHSQNSYKDVNAAQARCMRKIKELAFDLDAAIWVMQQTNRTAVSKEGDSSGMSNWQGSFEATQPASVWLTLQRTKEQKANFRADIIVNKSRHSQPKEDLLNIKFDNSTLQIDCEDTTGFYGDDLLYKDDMAFEPSNQEIFNAIINDNKPF